MVYRNRFPRAFLAVVLAVLTFAAPFAVSRTAAQQGFGQAARSQTAAVNTPDLAAQLAAVENAIDDKREELGIPGASLVVVKDDRVIYMKGLGVKDFERKVPVTPDTLFAIGSATKAFTALAAIMSADQGKLSLEDAPRKFLPYFKMRDPDADARITLRDLLSHRSGLNRTDLAMATGKLTRQELITVVSNAKPTAKLREKFQYQNVMYTAAGEMVAKAQNSTWDNVVAAQILRPLGMAASNTSVVAMQHAPDFSFGYDYNVTTKQTRRLPMRAIPTAAPAGAINSNARDMAQWLRFMLGGGVINGKLLVSEKGFAELVSKQINVSGNIDYGLGWALRLWEGHKVIEHGGNIDGFNAQVAMMPDQKLGFVLLTNVTASTLVTFAMSTVWSNLVGRKPAAEADTSATSSLVEPRDEVGTYRLAGAGVDFQVILKDGKLTLSVPGQPPYPLESLGGRRYRLSDPAPDGFFATFRPVKEPLKGKENETEMYLEQPQGNVVVPKVSAPDAAAVEAKATTPSEGDFSGPLKEILGSYESEQSPGQLEIGLKDGKVSLIVPGQPAYPLIEKGKDKLGSTSLPETYWIDVNRNAEGSVNGLVLNQPEGHFAFRRLSGACPDLTADQLIARMVSAHGGEENLRKHKSSVTTIEIDMENQGVQGQGFVKAKAPAMFASSVILTALGKKIGTINNYFDGTSGGQTISFAPEEIFTGKRLEDIRLAAAFYGPLSWKERYKSITIKRISKVGDEDAYVVEKVSDKGSPVTDYISTKSFLVLRRDSVISSETSSVEIPQTEYFSDYRSIQGVMIPFQVRSNNVANGDVVTRVKDVKFEVEIPDSAFRKPAVQIKPRRATRTRAAAAKS